jgi:hypothetical protein
MTLEIDHNKFIFKTKEIWFSEYPYDIQGYHSVSFRACKNKVDFSGFSCEEFTTLTIDLTPDLSIIWGNTGKSSCQYKIKRAIRDGIKVRVNQDYDIFFQLNREFRVNKGLPSGSMKIGDMKKYGTLFTAELYGEIIGGQLYLEDKDNIRFLLGASKRLESDKERSNLIGYGNRLLHWEAIKYAKEKMIKDFDFGGYYTGLTPDPQKEGINVFKESFGGKRVTHYIYQKDYSQLYKLARGCVAWQIFPKPKYFAISRSINKGNI